MAGSTQLPDNHPIGPNTVRASLLAKNANDNARFLNKRGVFKFFASKLAPTVDLQCQGLVASSSR